MNTRKLLCLIALVSLYGCAKPEPRLGAEVTTIETDSGVTITQADSRRLLPDGKIAGDEDALLTMNATVEKINLEKRMVSLKTANNDTLELVVGPEVRNLAQVKPGDVVSVEYLVSLAFEVRQPTEEEIAMAGKSVDVAARARLGQMPAGGAATAKIKIGKIDAINKSNGTVTISGLSQEGPTVIKAKYPENLNYAKVGDSIVVTMVQAFATSVTHATKK